MSSILTARRSLWSAGPKSIVMTTRYPLDHPGGVESVARALVDCLGRSEEGWRVSHVTAYSGRVGSARIPLPAFSGSIFLSSLSKICNDGP